MSLFQNEVLNLLGGLELNGAYISIIPIAYYHKIEQNVKNRTKALALLSV